MGSFLGALYALYENIQVVEYRAKELWEELKNPHRYIKDIAFPPLTPLTRGMSFSGMIMYFFGNRQIEDLYIPYFCVSTDLDDSRSRTHMSGINFIWYRLWYL
ncbi:unnamed protein product [Orchesella dallaii]|uniref:Uncharacterized protein n=1 Tax=Orchesella dallaii TaxID=48710 RepID=A0ABP1Q0K5_9HEXA